MLDYNDLARIDERVEGAFYLVNPSAFRANLTALREAFAAEYPHVQVAYAVKANYLPWLCSVARCAGCWAEVVSSLEYAIAEFAGFGGSEIIYNGPAKRAVDFARVLESGGLVQLDGARDLDLLRNYCREHTSSGLRVGVRINCVITDAQGKSIVYGGREQGRFGFLDGELPEVFATLRRLGVEVHSLHGHTTSKARLVPCYGQIAKRLLGIRQEYGLQPSVIDIGGGFFGPVPEGIFDYPTPAFGDYAREVATVLKADSWVVEHAPTLVVEPGVSVAAASLSYIVRVLEVRRRNDRVILQTDGTMFHVRSNMSEFRIPHRIISPGARTEALQETDVVGATCMEVDVLYRGLLPSLQVGDAIEFQNVGAYSLVQSPAFIEYPAPAVVCEEAGVHVVRNASSSSWFLEQFAH